MRVVAVAIHESVSTDRLHELFESDAAQVFSSTGILLCANCGTRFAVYYPDRENPDNQGNARELQIMIAQECDNGTHAHKEVVLRVGP